MQTVLVVNEPQAPCAQVLFRLNLYGHDRSTLSLPSLLSGART